MKFKENKEENSILARIAKRSEKLYSEKRKATQITKAFSFGDDFDYKDQGKHLGKDLE